jgi:bifunctional ADP-heptose synthase (sugar kinase/adenylyltransferase)
MISNGREFEYIPAHIRKIADVSGAGDTVISVASLCLALGLTNKEIASIANLAGGLVCEEIGVVPVKKELLQKEAAKI